jgi:hypothetical protein
LRFRGFRGKCALLFSALIVLLALATGFHHHDDGLDHDDCTVCVFVFHQGSGVYSPLAAQLPLQTFFFALLFVPVAFIAFEKFQGNVLGRAPPASI